MTTLQREGLSKAYLMAVAAAAGCLSAEPWPDADGVDWTITGVGVPGSLRSPKLDIQVKAHGAPPLEDDLRFALKQRNHDLLVGSDWHVPRILVVMIQDPADDPARWITLADEQLIVRHCAYWVSLASHQPSSNASSTTVVVPREQRFTPEALQGIMADIANRRFP